MFYIVILFVTIASGVASADITTISGGLEATSNSNLNLDCGTTTQQDHKNSYGTAGHGEVPWHAGIYAKAFTPYIQICEGTLVSASVVISAAHCFWNATKDGKLVPRQPASRYMVAIGKLYRPWEDARDVHAQKSEIHEISIPERFRGSVTNYQDDIAMLRLESDVQFNAYVRPVCLNFNYTFEKSQLIPGKYGKIATWQTPEPESSAEHSQKLQLRELPYIDIPQCFNKAPTTFQPFITSDKICAFGKDSFSVLCRGAAGGGLVFPSEEQGVTRYFLRGVVSASAVYRDDGCSQFVAFTQVSRHEHFVKQHLIQVN